MPTEYYTYLKNSVANVYGDSISASTSNDTSASASASNDTSDCSNDTSDSTLTLLTRINLGLIRYQSY